MLNNIHTRRGFTLIELLVVVLIIGILAAVALPQYQLAVDKTQFTKLITAAKTIKEAEESFYLANNKYTTDWNALDLSFNGEITGQRLTLPDGIALSLIGTTSATVPAVYTSHPLLPTVSYNVAFDNTTFKGEKTCLASKTNTRANRLCKNVTDRTSYSRTADNSYVYIFK